MFSDIKTIHIKIWERLDVIVEDKNEVGMEELRCKMDQAKG